jgi:GTP-binding protein
MNFPMRNVPRKPSPLPGASTASGGGPLGKRVEVALHGHRVGERPDGEPLPALAVLGRSNVGKSSLLNVLLGTKLAKVSQTPGRTQALYWYLVDGRFHVVDCPGYGYAKASLESRERFAAMIEAFLTGEPAPAAALLLVDGRLAPQEADRSMCLFLGTLGVPTVVAATKWDAVRPAERVRRRRLLDAAYASENQPLQPVSSETGEHLHDLARRLIALLGKATPPRGARAAGNPPQRSPHAAT